MYLASLLVVATTAASPSHAAPGQASDLVGLWRAHAAFDGGEPFSMSIERCSEEFCASAGGRHTSCTVTGETLHCNFGEAAGELRASVDGDGAEIRGHWVQPATMLDGTRYATPVVARRVSAGAWVGLVRPRADEITLFLKLEARDDGLVGGFIRNPERNAGKFLVFDRVSLDQDRVTFSREGAAAEVLSGRLRGDRDRLSIDISWINRTLDFIRTGGTFVPGFHARGGHQRKTAIAPPPALGDGWLTASPEEMNLDPGRIMKLVESIAGAEPTGVRAPYIHALLIARGGRLCVEEYFYGYDRETAHDTRSAAKSITSTLTGIAIGSHETLAVSSPVLALLQKYRDHANPDPRKDRISIEHLLTMSTGLSCDDNDPNSPGSEDRMQEQESQSDWYRFALDLRMVHEPGERGAYCSATVNLQGAVLREVTGQTVLDFFHERFARPLQIERYHMNLTPGGDAYLGGGLYLRPRDFLKLGQLFAGGGVWNGTRVVNEDWVRRATSPHQSLNQPGDYGYNWWLRIYEVGSRKYEAYYASGNGGQLVIVVPKLDLVVCFMAANYGDWSTWRAYLEVVVPRDILPAVISLSPG